MMLWKQLAERLKKGMHGDSLVAPLDRAHKPDSQDHLMKPKTPKAQPIEAALKKSKIQN